MTEQPTRPVKIDRTLVGAEVTVGGHTVQPMARLKGWYAGGSTPTSSGGGAWVRLAPVEVTVREGNGPERHVAVTDPTGMALRGLGVAAVLVATACALLILIARLTGGRD
jgi:hypothetical protein